MERSRMTAMPDCAAPDSVELDELSPSFCPADFQLTSDAELNCRILANVGNADVLAVQSQ
jgi:hypothetical protein